VPPPPDQLRPLPRHLQLRLRLAPRRRPPGEVGPSHRADDAGGGTRKAASGGEAPKSPSLVLLINDTKLLLPCV